MAGKKPDLNEVREMSAALARVTTGKLRRDLTAIAERKIDSRATVRNFRLALSQIIGGPELRLSKSLRADVNAWAATYGLGVSGKAEYVQRVDVLLTDAQHKLLVTAAQKTGVGLSVFLRNAGVLAAENLTGVELVTSEDE